MTRFAVLGAGVVGLGSALRIKKKYPNAEVVLIAKEFSPNTTGDGSAGFWFPYLCGDTAEEKLLEWGRDTYRLFHKLWKKGVKGICVIPAFVLDADLAGTDRHVFWKDFVFGYSRMDREHLRYMSDLHSTKYENGFYFTTFTAEPASLLPYLTKRFTEAGGKVLRAEVPSLTCELLKDFDVVVNCVGLGARTLVPDSKVIPIRGQVARVKAPWIFHVILNNSGGNYIIPNVECCVLGGTHQVNDYNTATDPRDSALIFQRCSEMIPSLQTAETVKEWVGLRPARDCVRLESVTIDDKLLIHNYGHGGSGVTLFWGCAGNVVKLLEQELNKNMPTMAKL